MRRAALLAALALGACGDDPIDVRKTGGDVSDYRRADLMAAIDRYVKAGRTPEAFGALARDVAGLRAGMDETVAELAELHLTLLAAPAVESVKQLPHAVQTERLATTVWPVALAPDIEQIAPDGWKPTMESAVALRQGESAAAYVRRMCEGPFAVECRHVVPEWQGPILGAEAITRMTQRARSAVANCEECQGEEWSRAVGIWEALERAAATDRRRWEDMGATSRWPVAGPGAQPWPTEAVPVVSIEDDGDWRLDDKVVEPSQRRKVLHALRENGGATIGVHLPPEARVEALATFAEAAQAAGFSALLLQARVDAYPWEPRAYLIPIRKKLDLGRATDTIQIRVRAFEARAGNATDDAAARARRP
jgi:hypothetical protein